MNEIMKRNRGITLIALVITIIVLLILAGVAIAMLSGENGILRKAAEAKTKTEQAQREEEARLTDMELTTYFATNNLQYKCSNGYITGFGYGTDSVGVITTEVKETIKDFEEILKPLGYKINFKYDMEEVGDIPIEESEKETTKIATGMSVQKDGKTVARTLVFGDVFCDGLIDSYDASTIETYYSFISKNTGGLDIKKDFQKIAADLNGDGEINNQDCKIAMYAELREEKFGKVNQNRIANKKVKRLYSKLQEYIIQLNNETGYTFEYNNETDTYKLKGVKKIQQ